jgi:hypothetical protein
VKEIIKKENYEKYPFRPVVIGGDDLTMIIRADLAVNFTKIFLKEFQNQTKANFKELVNKYKLNDFKDGLTACAGIAFMKPSYPFHYGVHLAEELCGIAKKASKEINSTNVPASLMFHKIQDSFVDTFKDIEERELTTNEGISFKYGPYFLEEQENFMTIEKLNNYVDNILTKDAPKSGIRKWLSYLYEDKNEAEMWLERVKTVTSERYIKLLDLDNVFKNNKQGNIQKTFLYDVLSLASISNTNKEENKNENN